jgi:hypothetical protein
LSFAIYGEKTRQLAIDIRGRWLEDLEKALNADRKRDSFDFYLRLTWGINAR